MKLIFLEKYLPLFYTHLIQKGKTLIKLMPFYFESRQKSGKLTSNMKKIFQPIGLLSMAILLLTACSNKRSSKPTILVFSKTAAFHHDVIPTGVKALQDLGYKNGFDVDTTTNAAYFQEDSLKKSIFSFPLNKNQTWTAIYKKADWDSELSPHVGIHKWGTQMSKKFEL